MAGSANISDDIDRLRQLLPATTDASAAASSSRRRWRHGFPSLRRTLQQPMAATSLRQAWFMRRAVN